MSVPADVLPAEPTPGNQDSEPLTAVAAITTVVTAILALLVALGLPVSDNVQTAILAVLAAVVPLVTALVGRMHVYSPKTVAALLAKARAEAPSSPPPATPATPAN